jgi:hypothetical protein
MRVTTLPLLILLFMTPAQNAVTGNKVDLDKEFVIRNGQEVTIKGEKLRIKFSSVASDSRCPNGVSCVWAGNATVKIEVSKKNKSFEGATLNTTVEPKELEYKGFKIKLVSLNPHPTAGATIDPKEYNATMIVSRNE